MRVSVEDLVRPVEVGLVNRLVTFGRCQTGRPARRSSHGRDHDVDLGDAD